MNNDPIAPLAKIRRVDTPAYILTRIEGRLQRAADVRLGIRQLAPIAMFVLGVIMLNAMVITQHVSTPEQETAELFGFTESDQLYR